MNSIDWEKVEEGVVHAAELPAGERFAWLDAFCDGDEKLSAEILSLLAFEDKSDSFLNHSVGQHAAALLDVEVSGRRFGPYRILSEIGQGGMGAVYLAERTDGEFEQRAALKVVRGSLPDRRMIERFRQERQILASLNHPNIARLLDGGVSDQAEPYLVMEFIEGTRVTDFARNERLEVDAILRLFLKICSAVAFAHRNLVVHRDIKPGNILVTVEGEPKLLDFGLARLTEGELVDREKTATLFQALTPAYASPEQFRNEPITTASDIYSLGVLLYELLTGSRPHDFENRPLHEIVTTISAGEPARPSSVGVRGSGNLKALKGDLDNIVLTALRKEPDLRYRSVGEFADDIERHLSGKPVLARPQTARYRAAKFLSRHRIGVAAAALLLTTLIGGTTASLWQARQARTEKLKAETVSEFLQQMLSASSPESTLKQQNSNLTVKQVLDEASNRLAAADLDDQIEVKAELQQIIGASYLSIGEYGPAEQNLASALTVQRSLYGEDSNETMKTLVLIASLWVSSGNYAGASDFFENRLDSLKKADREGRIEPGYLAFALYDYSMMIRARGDSPTAERMLRETLGLTKPDSGTGLNSGTVRSVLALTLADQGKFAEAELLVRDRADELRGRGGDSPELAAVLTALGSFLAEEQKYDQAKANLESAETVYRKLYAPTFLALGDNLRLQAQVAYFQQEYPKAEKLIDEALSIYQSGTSSQYVNYAAAIMIQGLIFTKTARAPAGEAKLRESLQIRRDNLPPGHYLTAVAASALGECLAIQKKYAEARPLLLEAMDSLSRSQGIDSPRTILARARLETVPA